MRTDEKFIMTNYSESQLKEIIGECLKEHSAKNGLLEQKHFDEEKLTQYQAAKYLNVSVQTIIRWRKQGLVKGYQIGRFIYYVKSELIDCLRSNPKLNK